MRPIDADELKTCAIEGLEKAWPYGGISEYTAVSVEDIDDAPTLDVEPVVHAHWVRSCNSWTHDMYKYGSTIYVCSKCRRYELCEEPYCNCGAKMDEPINPKGEEK